MRFRYERYAQADDGWGDDDVGYTVAIPAPAPPVIPPGGVRLPNLTAESVPQVRVAEGRGVPLSDGFGDSSCHGGVERCGAGGSAGDDGGGGGLNHQEAARALLAEA